MPTRDPPLVASRRMPTPYDVAHGATTRCATPAAAGSSRDRSLRFPGVASPGRSRRGGMGGRRTVVAVGRCGGPGLFGTKCAARAYSDHDDHSRDGVVAFAALATAPSAGAKGISFSLRMTPGVPRVGERLTSPCAAGEIAGEPIPACVGMRVLAVSPSVTIAKALNVVEGASSRGRSDRGGRFGSRPFAAAATRSGRPDSVPTSPGAGPS